jgi:hypothetical protein
VPRLKCLTLLTSDWVAEDGVLLLPESGSESTQQFHTSPLRADFSMHHLKGAPMSKSAASSGEQHVLVAILYSIDILSPDFRRLQTHTLVREGVVHPSVIYYKLLSYVTNGGELTQLTPTLPTNQYSQTRSRGSLRVASNNLFTVCFPSTTIERAPKCPQACLLVRAPMPQTQTEPNIMSFPLSSVRGRNTKFFGGAPTPACPPIPDTCPPTHCPGPCVDPTQEPKLRTAHQRDPNPCRKARKT